MNTLSAAFLNTFKLLILFLLVVPTIQSPAQLTSNLELVIKKNDTYNPYNTLIISENSQEGFLQQLTEREFKQSDIDISKTIAVYDSNVKRNFDNLLGNVLNYFMQVEPSGRQAILNVVDNTNKQLRDFSADVEKNCIQLMKNSYDKGIFATWNSLDNIEMTKKKIEEAEKLVEEQNGQKITKIGASTVAAAVSAVMGDTGSAASYLGQAGESLWDLLSSTKKKQEQIEAITTELQPTKQLSLEEKRDYENKLFTYSKLYCSFGYNLQLGFDEQTNNLIVFGDKIEHNWIVNLITVLEENLKVEITTLTVDAQSDKSKLTELNLLVSTLQRLDILKVITMKLSDIINFSFKSHIRQIQITPTKNTIGEVKNYFDDQLNDLNILLMKLNEVFPKQREKIEQEIQIVEAELELKTLEQNVLDMKSNADDIIRQRAAERYAADMASSWTATEAYAKSWITMSENAIKLTGEGLKTTVGGLTKEMANVVAQVPQEILGSTLSLLNNTLYQLISTPSGFLIISAPLIILLIQLGHVFRFINMFTWGGQKFLAITWGNLVITYKIIKTPFGYILNLVKPAVQDVSQEIPQIEQALHVMREPDATNYFSFRPPTFQPDRSYQPPVTYGPISHTPQAPQQNKYEEEEERQSAANALLGLGNYVRPRQPKRQQQSADDLASQLGSLSLFGGKTKRKYKHTKRYHKKNKKRTKRQNKRGKKHTTKHRIKKHKKTKRNHRK